MPDELGRAVPIPSTHVLCGECGCTLLNPVAPRITINLNPLVSKDPEAFTKALIDALNKLSPDA